MNKQNEGSTIIFCRRFIAWSIDITAVVYCSLLNQRLLPPFSHDVYFALTLYCSGIILHLYPNDCTTSTLRTFSHTSHFSNFVLIFMFDGT